MDDNTLATRQLEKHIEFCRELEHTSSNELDKLKLSLPAILLAVLTFLATSRQLTGLWFNAGVTTTCLCLIVTAFSYYAAAAGNRKEYADALTENGVPTKHELRRFEAWSGKCVGFSNGLSLWLALASIALLIPIILDLPLKPSSPTEFSLDRKSIESIETILRGRDSNIISLDSESLSKLGLIMRKAEEEGSKPPARPTTKPEEKGSKSPARPGGDGGKKK